MTTVFSPNTVGPPMPKKAICRISPASTTGKTAQPKINPISPLRIKWTDEPSMGTWMDEATKKADPRTAAFGICSSSRRRKPINVPAAATTAPAAKTH